MTNFGFGTLLCPPLQAAGKRNRGFLSSVCVRAVPGKAGGAAIMATVDHPLMRGLDRMTGGSSRSCLGLATCVGSVIRQIVCARVLLTAAAPPALPGGSMSNGSLAPALRVIIRFPGSARWYRHLPGDRPDKARQLASDCRGDDIGRLAGAGEPAI